MGTRNKQRLKQLFDEPRMKELIDSLWRDFLALYKEQKLSQTDLTKIDPENIEDYDERYVYTRSSFSEEDKAQLTSWAYSLGYGHVLRADFAQVFGFFNYASSFFQTVLGSFAEIPSDQTPHEWVETDLHLVLGNGKNKLDRSNAFEVFKSGLFYLFNGFKVGAFEHGEELPESGVIQYTEENLLEMFFEGAFHKFLFEGNAIGVCQNGRAGTSDFHPATIPSNMVFIGSMVLYADQTIEWIN